MKAVGRAARSMRSPCLGTLVPGLHSKHPGSGARTPQARPAAPGSHPGGGRGRASPRRPRRAAGRRRGWGQKPGIGGRGGFGERAGGCGNFPSLRPGRSPRAGANFADGAPAPGVPRLEPGPRAPSLRVTRARRGLGGPRAGPAEGETAALGLQRGAQSAPPRGPAGGWACAARPSPWWPWRAAPPAWDGRLLSRVAVVGPRRPGEGEAGGGYSWAPARRRRLRLGPECRRSGPAAGRSATPAAARSASS